MGRTSKFSFPMPGRKKASSTSLRTDAGKDPRVSKAQRLLGVEGALNIDSPIKDEDGTWHTTRPASSGMSIAISESTQEEELASTWDEDSDVLPRALNGKASSTLLGKKFIDDGSASNDSSDRRLRHESSSSTLKSHYDRQKSPLSISQQTSASSARDLALRKGFPPVVSFPRSPLLDVEMTHGITGELYTLRENDEEAQLRSISLAKKKPGRLDLSRMWSKGKKDLKTPPVVNERASSLSSRGPQFVPKKLTKSPAKASKPKPMVQPRSIYGNIFDDDEPHQPRDMYEQYATEALPELPVRTKTAESSRSASHKQSPRPAQRRPPQTPNSSHEYADSEMSSEDYLRQMRANIRPPFDKQSIASSKRTSTSIFSESDLRNQSILSFSSEEDSDGGKDKELPGISPKKKYSRDSGHSKDVDSMSSRSGTRSVKSQRPHPTPPALRLSTIQDGNFLTIPLPSPGSSRISGPWASAKASPKGSPKPRSSVINGARRPDSPESMISLASTDGRVMTVTKQEEALLSALRQKRAMMKNKIIQEHEGSIMAESPRGVAGGSVKSHRIKSSSSSVRSSQSKPASMHSKPRDSNASTIRAEVSKPKPYQQSPPRQKVSHSRGPSKSSRNPPTEQILLYLDQPISKAHEVDTAEPSPDLSDFLSFGSDDDEDDITPRTSWIVDREGNSRHGKERARPDSMLVMASPTFDGEDEDGAIDEDLHNHNAWPPTPRSAARLSAVGAPMSFPTSKPQRKSRRPVVGVPEETESWNHRLYRA